jgi:hypothetical protein
MELCNEVVRLKAIADEKHGEYSDFTLMPFGRYAKPPDGPRKLADVPNEYLEWWLGEHLSREVIALESQYGPHRQRYASKQNLKLYDYIQRRLNHDSEIQGTGEGEAEAQAD